MSNPVLDEIPDSCISDDMREKLIEERKKEDCNRLKEVEIFREYIIEKFSNHFNNNGEVEILGNQYFRDLSSTDIIENFISPYVAYVHCMEKARQDIVAEE